ncbi:MAG: hypothetical protein K2H15_04880, partial [Muribaculaceae bacterium]|nr:hypothetical protein [Muribaculaceae bacterium]
RPSEGNIVVVPSIEEGIYSATMNIEAPAYDPTAPIQFKIFNTLASDWSDATQYYGALAPDNYCSIFKDAPAKWTLAPGWGSSDFVITNASSLSDAVVTINLKENTASISSVSAPLPPQQLFLADGGEDGVKYPLQRVGDTSEFKGTVNLDPGVHRIAITGNNDYLLGSDSRTYYLWNDREANIIMMANSQNPYIIGNWIGGQLEVTVNITSSMVSFVAPNQPNFPESIKIVIKGENGEDTSFSVPSFKNEYNFMTFNYTIENWQKDMQFLIEVPGVGTLKTDSQPIELWKDRWEYVNLNPDYDNLISISNWKEGNLTVEINEYFSSVSMRSATQPLPEQHLYLIGSPQNPTWGINDGSMELTQIDNSIFTGEFDMPADPIFRFYTELGNWNLGSVGSQYDDYPVVVELNTGNELTVNTVYGKGSWTFAGFPGGKMYMKVDLLNMKATFSTSPISASEMIGEEVVKIAPVKGGIEVTAPYSLSTIIYDVNGRIVGNASGSATIFLQPGVYIANKKKVIVR